MNWAGVREEEPIYMIFYVGFTGTTQKQQQNK